MDAHQDRPAVGDVTHGQRDVLRLGVAEACLVTVHQELAVLRRQLRGRDALDHLLARHAVRDEVLDRDHLQAVPLCEALELRETRHRAVGVGDLADDADGLQAGEPAEIHCGLGLAGAHQHAALARSEREHVPGLDQVLRGGIRVGEDADRACPVRRADAGRDALARIDAHRERGPETSLVALHHLWEVELLEPFGRHRDADHTARVLADEPDHFRRACLGREREVAFVLAVLVIDDDDHSTGCDLGDRLVDGAERRLRGHDPRVRRDLLRACDLGRDLPHTSSLGHDLRSKRSTYFATMSTSRFTFSPTRSAPSVVRSAVCGMRATSK